MYRKGGGGEREKERSLIKKQKECAYGLLVHTGTTSQNVANAILLEKPIERLPWLATSYGVVPKGLLTFLGFFMQCGV